MKVNTETILLHPKGKIESYTLDNEAGFSVTLLNYGGRLTAINVPDRDGFSENVVLNLENIDGYLADQAYFGALVGPVAGRIRNGKWKAHQLTQNQFPHHIHGGIEGFHQQIWHSVPFVTEEECGVQLSLVLPDGTDGYPGELQLRATYTITKNQELKLEMLGSSNQETLFNPTNHAYFNLSGNGKEKISTHILQIASDQVAELDHEKIPTGRLMDVEGTNFDFQSPKLLARQFFKQPQGYDDAFKLKHKEGQPQLYLADPKSKRKMEITTSEESVVVFTTTNMNENYTVFNQKMSSQLGIAIEPQGLPDAVHHSNFQSILLQPGIPKKHQTIYQFGLIDE